ncbi:tyrosine-type recombinase/integrase [Sphingobium sp. CCH11-B1]|uniref:tyrosine-type recombinase/integrase n=1 Tax=Sphingobium sp. CCH11-B1 TaxID=1768781 RepID=UPI001E5B181A|nr:site-specific integrase [Sphingobium sp. CCH11-B1]
MIRPALDEFTKRNAAPYLPETGTPSLLYSDGHLVAEIRSFITFLRSDGVSLASAGHYARDLQVFARYLRDAHSKSLLDASSADVGKYRALRLEGPSDLRLSGTSWRRSSAALTRFYQWAASEEAALMAVAPKTRFRRDGAVAEDTIRMIPLEDYVLFRDQGLLGQHQGTSTTYRRNPMRDAAFAELLVTTGVRLEEGASLLIGELPTTSARAFEGSRSAMIDLPATITKGRKPRSVPFPKRVAGNFIDPYVREERSQLVDRWRRAGGIRTMRQPLIGSIVGGRRILMQGEQRLRPLASLRIDERRNLLLLPGPDAPPENAQPAALWLAQDGSALTPAAWQSIFRRTSKKLSETMGWELAISPHTLRHTFAVYWLTHLIKAEVARLDRRSLPDRTEEIYMKVVSDPLRRVQRWLGHASILTTEKYLTYLDEAFEIVDQAAEALDVRLMGFF